MIPSPNPLHPAVAHFPIVLILLGTVVGLIAVFIRCWQLPLVAAGLLTLGALGALAATWSGDEAEDSAGELPHKVEEVLEEHEEWGETTRNVAMLAALLALAAAAISRFPVPARGLSAAAALVAIWASYCVLVTGHRGGELVYRYGVGVSATAIGEEASHPSADGVSRNHHH